MAGRPAGTRDIHPSIRVAVVLFLAQHSVAGICLKGAVKEAVVKFIIGRVSVAKI
ncbi:hypothetical protein PF003_g1895 [Phytophthora fragariae]|nr:hypothetical protein PF003_g1895 [Phytophthora fragariae]